MFIFSLGLMLSSHIFFAHSDRVEAAKKTQSPAHRFQLQNAEPSPILQSQLRGQPGQQFYYIQPSAQQSSGQIEAFLRGQNLEY